MKTYTLNILGLVLQTIFHVSTVSTTAAIHVDAAQMAVDYFSYKKVKQICFISCSETKLSRHFASIGWKLGISMSIVTPMNPWHRLKKCAQQERVAVGIVFNVGCRGATIMLQNNSLERNFDAMHNWLIVESARSIDKKNTGFDDDRLANEYLTSKYILKQLNISVDAEITVARSTKSNGFQLFDVFNFGKIQGGSLNVTSMGSWTPNSGLYIWLTGYKYQRRWDFHNLTLRAISVMLFRPTTFTSEILTGREYTPGVSAMTKITSMVLDLFREKHNFRFNYTIVDRWVGGLTRNSALAVTNSMQWEEQDISCTCLRIFPSWLDWMDPFFPPITELETKFYYRIPTEGIGKMENEFLRPFSRGVWIAIICAGLLCILAIAAAANLEGQSKIIELAFFSVIGAFCQQSRKVAILVTGLSSLLLYNYYTSSVVSWLLNAPPSTIHSLDELISSSLEVVFEDIGYTRSWLEVPGYYYSRNRDRKENILRDKKVKSGNRKTAILQSIDSGIELVKRGGYAYHTEPYNANIRIGKTFTQEELCDLGSLQMMERAPVYVVGQRRSPYREFFVWSMLRAMEGGHVSCMRRRVHVSNPQCAGSTPRALALGGATPAFLLLIFCGWSASLLLLLLELSFYSYYSRSCNMRKHKCIE